MLSTANLSPRRGMELTRSDRTAIHSLAWLSTLLPILDSHWFAVSLCSNSLHPLTNQSSPYRILILHRIPTNGR